MPVIALTDANLSFVKSSLRTAAKDVKSSHLSEAIAASFMYQSHAALLADRAKTSVSPKAGQGCEYLFADRLETLGAPPVGEDVYSDILWSTEMPEPVWRSIDARDRAQRDAWFWHCKQQNIPYIQVLPRRTLARVEWDCISLEPPCDSHISGNNNLLGIMFRAFQAMASRKDAIFDGSAFVGSVEGLLIDEARRFADGVALLLFGAIVRN